MIRLCDIIFSIIGLLISFVPMLIISVAIKLDTKGPVLFKQQRVGLNGKLFNIFKFRTMYTANKNGLSLTVGNNDKRITRVGYYLRKHKIDELPQLLNVLKGEMSFVGPRPEVPEYVDYYTENDKEILKIKPGITDNASIKYFSENEILAKSNNPKEDYINIIMKEKLILNRVFLENKNIKLYFEIILNTLKTLFQKH
jgi:lipopolysaccharide/colanic/teichoic acid biosynthesis glycosyltransferase